MAYIGQNLDRFSIVEKLDVITPATATGAGPYNLTKNSIAFIPASADTMVVSINGVSQYGNFTVNGSTITFSGALTDADTCDFIYQMGTGLISTPADGTVNIAKLSATGTKDATTFLRGDNTFATVSGDISSVVAGTGLAGGGTTGDVTLNIEAAQPTVTSTGTLTSFRSTGIDDNANATAMTIDSSERVGIGTNSPSSTLDLVAQSNSTCLNMRGRSSDNKSRIEMNTANNSAINLQIEANNDGANYIKVVPNQPLIFRTSNIDAMNIDGSGHITKPLQPAVHAYLNTTQSNIATGVVTVQLNAEIYDVNSDFNTSNYTFTAPVTGKYLVTMNLVMTDVDTAFQWIYLLGVSSNRNYYLDQIDPRIEMVADGIHTWTGSSLVDMDANDTFIMKTRSSAHGAAQMDIAGGTAAATETTMTMTLLS